jgi:transcriptional regulator with XRE-family HTH domain
MADRARRQADALFQTIRQLLRRRRMTYRELGRRIGLSESGVKKLFSAGNCSVARLAEVAEVLEVPLSELARLAEEPAIHQVELSDGQQRWLLEHLDCFCFYWMLAIERRSPARIRAEHGLTARQVRRWLSELDDLGLIALEPGDRIRIPRVDLVRWRDRGPLLDRLNRDWSRALLHDLLAAPGEAGRVFRLTYLEMRPESARELGDALERLTDEWVRRARYEQATTAPDGLVARRFLGALVDGSFVTSIPRRR